MFRAIVDLWKIYFHSVRVHSQSQSKGTGNNVDHFTLLRHQKVEAVLPKYLSRDVFDGEGEGATALPAPFYSAMYVISKKFLALKYAVNNLIWTTCITLLHFELEGLKYAYSMTTMYKYSLHQVSLNCDVHLFCTELL